MPPSFSLLWSFALATLGAQVSNGQATREYIWSSVVVSTFGDRVPLLSPALSVLTPLGAQQMFDAGSFFRSRYITDTIQGSAIPSLSTNSSDQTQTIVMALNDMFVQQSAGAFMNGLYPPLDGGGAENLTQLANGSRVTGPLNGLQYPIMNIYSSSDPDYTLLSPTTNCPGYNEELQSSYIFQPSYQNVKVQSQPLYNQWNSSLLQGIVPGAAVDFANAYAIWEYMNYMDIHNSTSASLTTDQDLSMARYLADQYALHTLGNINDTTMSMGGRGLSSLISLMLAENVASNGTQNMLSLLFASWEPMYSLMYLLGLPQNNPTLHTIPNTASSLVFELYSVDAPSSGSIGNVVPTYPSDANDLYVRVLFHNGSSSNATFAPYTMASVGNSSQSGVSLASFNEAFASWRLGSIADWCTTCGSTAIFCVGALSDGSGSGYIDIINGSSGGCSGISGPVAGAIGAILALAFAGVGLAAFMLLGGFRFRRDRPSVVAGRGAILVHKRRKSSMGGFKGAGKMASDIDLPKGGAAMGASVVPVHARSDSWEMKDGAIGERMESAGPRGQGHGHRRMESDATVVGEPGPEISEGTGLKVIKDEDEELDGLKPVKVRESF